MLKIFVSTNNWLSSARHDNERVSRVLSLTFKAEDTLILELIGSCWV